MAAPTQDTVKPELPDAKEVAKTYAEVAERASKLITEHMQRQVKKGIAVPSDELGIAQAFMDMMAKMLSNPYKLAQARTWQADYSSIPVAEVNTVARRWLAREPLVAAALPEGPAPPLKPSGN